MRSAISWWMLPCITLLVASGCGNRALAPSTGVVQLDGQPLSAGRIVFRPTAGGYMAVGDIQPDGSFVMRVEQRWDGAQIGENHILVIDAQATASADKATYQAPASGRVVVKAAEDNEFTINVSEETGWKRKID